MDLSKLNEVIFKKNSENQAQDENMDSGATTGVVDSDEVNILKDITRMFNREDFERLRIIGQFNKGFILATLGESEELFILDQHACDEKTNFERLSQTTEIHGQPLIQTIRLDLSVSERLVLEQNLRILELNGFKLEQRGEVPNEEWHIVQLPISKTVVFNESDLLEVLAKLVEAGSNAIDAASEDGASKGSGVGVHSGFKHKQMMIRPKKVYQMLAMRACRSSIMIGTTLPHTRMQSVAHALAALESPWNCPHGRPTMRFLS